jgi:hypothetical protein
VIVDRKADYRVAADVSANQQPRAIAAAGPGQAPQAAMPPLAIALSWDGLSQPCLPLSMFCANTVEG